MRACAADPDPGVSSPPRSGVEWRVWLEVLGQSPVCNTPFFDIFMSRQRIYQVGANTGTDSAVGFLPHQVVAADPHTAADGHGQGELGLELAE